jgi:hypothetical protein
MGGLEGQSLAAVAPQDTISSRMEGWDRDPDFRNHEASHTWLDPYRDCRPGLTLAERQIRPSDRESVTTNCLPRLAEEHGRAQDIGNDDRTCMDT